MSTTKVELEVLDKVHADVMEVHSNLCEMMELMLRVEHGDVTTADEIFRALDNLSGTAAAVRNHANQVLKAHHLLREGQKQMAAAKEISKKFFDAELGMTMELPE